MGLNKREWRLTIERMADDRPGAQESELAAALGRDCDCLPGFEPAPSTRRIATRREDKQGSLWDE
jgi:hypothetical protein